MTVHHTPVMLAECLEGMNLTESSHVVDCTTGEGGHSFEIAARVPHGHLYCLDRDERILAIARDRLKDYQNVSFHNMTFDGLPSLFIKQNTRRADSIFADLGISMFHLKGHDDSRPIGMSYTDTEALDMRLSPDAEISAADVVNKFREEELANIIYHYGEERDSRRIARAVVAARPVLTAEKLASVVMKAVKGPPGKAHPATRTFQALRIFVNKELEILESFIPLAVDNLEANGRLVILTYHSLEDRIVKHAFKALQDAGCGTVITKKPLVPQDSEIRINRAARSAKLRIFEKGENGNACRKPLQSQDSSHDPADRGFFIPHYRAEAAV